MISTTNFVKFFESGVLGQCEQQDAGDPGWECTNPATALVSNTWSVCQDCYTRYWQSLAGDQSAHKPECFYCRQPTTNGSPLCALHAELVYLGFFLDDLGVPRTVANALRVLPREGTGWNVTPDDIMLFWPEVHE